MKKFTYPICILLLLLVIGSCGNDKLNTSKTRKPEQLSPVDIPPLCSEKEEKNPEGTDPIIIKTCAWAGYNFVKTGQPDEAGRYWYDYAVFSIKNNTKYKVENKELFNSKQKELEVLINKKIAKELKEYRKDEENADCLSDVGDPHFTLNEMGISFDDKQNIVFTVSFSLGSYCLPVRDAAAKFQLSEIKEYLK